MKRTVLMLAISCILTAAANAQQIRISPFDGRWTWDERGEDIPDFTELVFCGNVMLGLYDEDIQVYTGETFTYTGRTITFTDSYEKWEYRFAGNALIFTNEDDESWSYTKMTMEKSPIEGIWKVTGGAGYDPHEENHLLFTGDIMAFNDEDEYEGFKIEFKGKTFHPSRNLLGENFSEKELQRMTIEYRISGTSLTIIDPDGDELRLTKIY